MTGPERGIVVGVLGQWASGKSTAARTLVAHLGGRDRVVFLSDRALMASQAVSHFLALDDSEVTTGWEDDGRQRLEGGNMIVWLRPGEDLRSVDPALLQFDPRDDDLLDGWRKRAKAELGHQVRQRPAEGKPVVIEAAFGPNVEPENEHSLRRTIPDFFARLEGAGVDVSRAMWIIIEATAGTRAARNSQREDRIPPQYFARYAADGGDLHPDQQKRLEDRGTAIARVRNDHDDIERFRADIIAAFEKMRGGALPAGRGGVR